jgi:hypothetical protein
MCFCAGNDQPASIYWKVSSPTFGTTVASLTYSECYDSILTINCICALCHIRAFHGSTQLTSKIGIMGYFENRRLDNNLFMIASDISATHKTARARERFGKVFMINFE